MGSFYRRAAAAAIQITKKAAFVSEGCSRGLNLIYLPGVVSATTTLRLISDWIFLI
jgi:hypothetical protein